MSKAINVLKNNFILLIQNKELHEIKVTELCQLSHVNRSTFYANFYDIYDLANKLSDELEDKYIHMVNIAMNRVILEDEFHQLFTDVKKHPMIYTAYFKIKKDQALLFKERQNPDLSNPLLAYNSIFFRSGIVSIIKLWIQNDCTDSIDDMVSLVVEKYAFIQKNSR